MESHNNDTLIRGVSAEDMKYLVDAVADFASEAAIAKRSERKWSIAKRTFIATMAVLGFALWVFTNSRLMGLQSDPVGSAVALIDIEGEIAPMGPASADGVVPLIERACTAKHVTSVVLQINSGGGAPSEAERIISAMEACRTKETADKKSKPIYAVVDGTGASAAYMIAMHADRVYAGRYSLVGSIGAILRYNDLSGLANRHGVKEQAIRSAPLKGGPSLVSGITADEQAAYQVLVDGLAKSFLQDVRATRGAKLKADDAMIASGRVWTASDALKLGLIDEIATIEDLKRHKFQDVTFHRYRRKSSFAEAMGLKAVLREVAFDAIQPEVR